MDLQKRGVWLHLWRTSGIFGNVSIFDVESNEKLHEILSGLPFFSFLTMEITPLSRHPSRITDPPLRATWNRQPESLEKTVLESVSRNKSRMGYSTVSALPWCIRAIDESNTAFCKFDWWLVTCKPINSANGTNRTNNRPRCICCCIRQMPFCQRNCSRYLIINEFNILLDYFLKIRKIIVG